MPVIINTPSWIPSLEYAQACAYTLVFSTVVVVYDYVLHLDQEVERALKLKLQLAGLMYMPLSDDIQPRFRIEYPAEHHPPRHIDGATPRPLVDLATYQIIYLITPVWCGIGLAYDLALLLLGLYRVVWQLKEQKKQGSLLGVKGLLRILTQHHMAYFLAVLVTQLLWTVASNATDMTLAETQIIEMLYPVFNTMVTCVLGPWLILGVRSAHRKQLNQSPDSRRDAVSTVAFRSPPSQADPEAALSVGG
ncbi:hypothetical protein CONPUDRAFT_75410 [Coniophora puteana RWD-64-598 SS2]|uniref:Uncharacterized protein n=1 Tax=Coniophora puteana (strain RWD-64-598) TaxID=741705 RepID=A0A5M3MEA4_CONPW|nr:uncharacterized protein CONPUDRAFT_75410 [Coniophora puteana RWD-64-598 SS2]EIW77552.1 hypothetical protein CONPUDRAFT_75410 [Coniophora puteana RWD-64-598 SS2]